MMKKILILIVVLFCITGCSIDETIDVNHSYDKIVCNYDGNKFELKIDTYRVGSDGRIEVHSGNNKYLLSTNKCYLVKEN